MLSHPCPVRKRDYWNRCNICGRFISMDDFDTGKAVQCMLTPDTEETSETYETLCKYHRPILLKDAVNNAQEGIEIVWKARE